MANDTRKINVNLYGGKSIFKGVREKPLEADEIYCDCADDCTFYKEGKCLRCRVLFSPRCKFGRTVSTVGYTSRAKKYRQFERKYTEDDLYGKLSYPHGSVGVMNGWLYMHLTYVSVEKYSDETPKKPSDIKVGDYLVREAHHALGNCYIPLEDVTPLLLHTIFSFEPTPHFGYSVIKEYGEECVPNLLTDLRKVAPDIFNRLIAEYPQYDISPNYIGRKAYISTLKEGAVITDFHNNSYTFKGGKLYGTSVKGVSSWGTADVVITPSENSTIEITDNEQCDENTKFL